MTESKPLHDMGISAIHDPGIRQAVMFICNVPFSDVLDPCKNSKFPGGLAVSMSRETLPLLGGLKSNYLPYKMTDVLSWMSPTKHVIPQMELKEVHNTSSGKPLVPKDAIKQSIVSEAEVEFGDSDGFFGIVSTLCAHISELDFGGEDGLFYISDV